MFLKVRNFLPFTLRMSSVTFNSPVDVAMQRAGNSRPGSLQQTAQISVLKQANEVQARTALTLITGIGVKLDTSG